ncbi:rhamnan synthesis F family protein [Kaistia defluvii]|uniref:Lipopolysaccharide biosynthesis protein n=1 Tax=Kaistia defluvii TaxID=410841 RepID=A0ABV2R3L4_9HYPH
MSDTHGSSGLLRPLARLWRRARRADRSSAGLDLRGSSRRPIRYLLELEARPGQRPFVPLQISRHGQPEASTIYVPCLGRTRYVLEVSLPAMRITFSPQQVAMATRVPLLRWLRRLGPSFRRAERRLGIEIVDGLRLTPLLYGRGPEAHELAATLRTLRGWGLGVESQNFQEVMARAVEPPARPYQPRAVDPRPRIGIVLHLHYVELWPEFEALLAGLERPLRLLVTTTAEDPDLAARITDGFPGAVIKTYPNRGRDIGPFIGLLRDGHLDGLDLLCKLHGKRSGASGARAVLGEMWRRASVGDLIGSRDVVDEIVRRFSDTPEIGMIGSRRFRLPNEHMGLDSVWGANHEQIRMLAQQLGLPDDRLVVEFFAGTMFWVRRDVLDALAQLPLDIDSFPPEAGQLDGTLHHALERVFGLLPGLAGKRLEDTLWSSTPTPALSARGGSTTESGQRQTA